MKRLLILSAFGVLGLFLLVLVGLETLPLEVIWATPLRFFVSYEQKPTQMVRTQVADRDEFWRVIDGYAAARGFNGFPKTEGTRGIDYFSRPDDFGISVVIKDGIGYVSFAAPTKQPLAQLVADFKQYAAGFAFEG